MTLAQALIATVVLLLFGWSWQESEPEKRIVDARKRAGRE